MKTYQINDKTVELDDSLEYFDFYLEAGNADKPMLVGMDMAYMLEEIQNAGRMIPATRILYYLSRWVHEAPRKRMYREMIRTGMNVLCRENFFPEDGGDKIINGLENTGKIAVEVCNALGITPLPPIQNDDPIKPATLPEFPEEKHDSSNE